MKRSSRLKPGRRPARLLLITLVVLAATFATVVRTAYASPSPGRRTSLSDVYGLAGSGKVVRATLLDEDALVVGVTASGARFHAAYPRSDVATQQLIQRLTESGAAVVIDTQTGKGVAKLLATFLLPLLILANLFGLILLGRPDGGVAEIARFGGIGRRRGGKGGSTGVSFADVAGLQEAVTELREVTDYLRDPKRFEAFGAAPPKGVLLFGPPGCGKTLLARAVAGETGVAFFSISGAEFVESLVGVGAARVRDLFRQVRAAAPAIVFIDEIDAVGRRRTGDALSGGEREQTVNQLLVEIDGFEVATGVVVIGATNRADILDPALLRPGRFDRRVTVHPPDVHGRHAILELHARSRPLSQDVDLEDLARRTPGFTGADLANVLNEAALLALRESSALIEPAHLFEAVQRVLHGPQRVGRLLTAEERTRIAVHETGHAVAAVALGHGTEIDRVSVVARGQGLGQTLLLSNAERVVLTVADLEAQLCIAMAGTAAEELVFGTASTAGEHDCERATTIAREMAGRYGLSSRLGRVQVLHSAGENGNGPHAVSAQALADLDQEVRRLVERAEQAAADILVRCRPVIDQLVERLMQEETLEGPQLAGLLAAVRPESTLFVAAAGPAPRSRAAGTRTRQARRD